MVENETVAPCLQEHGSSCYRDNVAYLNNAGQARLSPKAKQAGIDAMETKIFPHADDDQRRVRQLFAQLIEASEADIAVHPSTGFAITMAAENIYRQLVGANSKDPVGANDGSGISFGRIVVLEDQMCSAVYAWQELCQRSDGKLKLDIVPFPEESSIGGWTESILATLNNKDVPKVAACCLPPLHWSDGSLIDLVAIGKVCREQGIFLIVDSTQATGVMPCSVKDIKPTLLACSVHKWLRSCSGLSLVYIDPAFHGLWQPLDQHGRGRDLGSDTYDAAKDEMGKDGYPTKYFSDARKFDSGGKPNPLLLPILRASLEEVSRLNVDEAQVQLKTLMSPLLEWARRGGYTVPLGAQAYHLVGIRPRNLTPEQMIDIASKLEEEGIYVAVRCGAFRVSPYIDTIPQDIKRLIEALDHILKDSCS